MTRPGTNDQELRRAADLFHEIGSAISAKDLVANCRNAVLAEKLRENLRSPEQLKKISGEGFELCVLALAKNGAADVTIHECGASALGEQPWGSAAGMRCTGTLVHDEFSTCPVHDHGDSDVSRCSGTRVHGEFTACPVHDEAPRRTRTTTHEESTATVLQERDAYRAMVCDLLASASPNERDHPSMSKQWARARELLKHGPRIEVPSDRRGS